jgi:hypothetical protein
MVTTGAPNDKPMSAETEPPSCTVSSGLGLERSDPQNGRRARWWR